MSRADDEEPLPPREEAELLSALQAALRPSELDPSVNERLVAAALEDPLAPPSEAELAESVRLREALDHGVQHEDLAALAALRHAALPSEDPAALQRALEGALGTAEPGRARPGGGRRRGNVVYAAFGAAGAMLAAAAALLLFLGPARHEPAPAAARYAEPRTTAPLFSERFELGATTARVDLIAAQRGRDLRDNRYAAWGVR